MIARGFKPVGWVAAVAGSALGCYMLSLNVASERADLARVERQIIAAKQDIRSLQTELGTRGRMQQLEHWNADVLALSAPAATQYMDSEYKLASFSQPQQTLEDKATVRMASAETVDVAPQRPVVTAASVTQDAPGAARPMVRRASFTVTESSPLAEKAPAKVTAKVEIAKPVVKAPPVKVADAKAAAPKPVAAKPKKSALSDGSLAKAISDAAAKEAKNGGAGGQ